MINVWYSLHRYKLVFLDADDHGPSIILDGERVRLEMKRAKPLRGVRIGSNYFTSISENQLQTVVDNDF